MVGGIGPWIEAGAPGAELRQYQRTHAYPVELFGEILSAKAVAGLLHLSERGIQRFAATATRRDSDWLVQSTFQGTDGTPQTISRGWCGEYLNAKREPLPLLMGADGSLLRAADRTCFAVVAGPSGGRRGRPRTTSGESPWQFRQSHTVGVSGGFTLPDWWPAPG